MECTENSNRSACEPSNNYELPSLEAKYIFSQQKIIIISLIDDSKLGSINSCVDVSLFTFRNVRWFIHRFKNVAYIYETRSAIITAKLDNIK